jgi:hypothetical protein
MRRPLDQNRYIYVAAGPTRFLDPKGLTKLEFQVGNDFLIVDPEIPGRAPYMMLATSGVDACINQVSCQTIKNKGPIPLGFYRLLTSEISNPGTAHDFVRNLLGDWGDWRVPLHPEEGTETFGRDGFFLHGGRRFGSLGCIDVGGGKYGDARTNQLLLDLLADPDGIVPLAVVRD